MLYQRIQRLNIYQVYRRPVGIRRHIRTLQHKVCANIDIVRYSELLGKGIILFVFFASSLNWIHYRNLRKQMDEDQDTENQKNKKKNK